MIIKSFLVVIKYIIASLIHFVNLIVKVLAYTLRTLFFFLPDSPFTSFIESFDSSIFAPLGYVLPVHEMAAVMQAWIAAVGIYYMYTIALRWFKAIE